MVEDQDPATFTLNHIWVELSSTNHRFGQYCGHDSAIRTSSLCWMRERPINIYGLACADQGHPRATLDVNDLWIPGLGAKHPVESYGQLTGRCYLGYSFWLAVAAV